MKAGMLLFCGVLIACYLPGVQGGENLKAEFFPQRHHHLQGKWKTKNVTYNKSADHGHIVAKLNSAELRLLIPTKYIVPPQAVSIYLVLPTQIPGMRGTAGFEVSWKTRKVLHAGTARPGDRVLLYQGIVNSDVLSDFVSFELTMDAAEMIGAINFEPSYEIERR